MLVGVPGGPLGLLVPGGRANLVLHGPGGEPALPGGGGWRAIRWGLHPRGARVGAREARRAAGAPNLGRGLRPGPSHADGHEARGEADAPAGHWLGGVRAPEVVVRGEHGGHTSAGYPEPQHAGCRRGLPDLLERALGHGHVLAVAAGHGRHLGPRRRAGHGRGAGGGVCRKGRERHPGALRRRAPCGAGRAELRVPLRRGSIPGREAREGLCAGRAVQGGVCGHEALGLQQPGDQS
mmetsp:Transcript_108364/g.302172  ORF Transcript_108364/g.302172 Transcript_108364/m.302172 type:complete len:237 (-) Transcript_108364:195-905(-)